MVQESRAFPIRSRRVDDAELGLELVVELSVILDRVAEMEDKGFGGWVRRRRAGGAAMERHFDGWHNGG